MKPASPRVTGDWEISESMYTPNGIPNGIPNWRNGEVMLEAKSMLEMESISKVTLQSKKYITTTQ
jgi:hypothetical protein